MDYNQIGRAVIRLYYHARTLPPSLETVVLGTTIKAGRFMDFAERIRRRGSELSHDQITTFARLVGLPVLCCLGTFPRLMASDRLLLGRRECGKHRPSAEEQGDALSRNNKLPVGELKKEFATGQARLQELEKQQMYLRETMLRISGAIQVLEELLADGGSAEPNGAYSGEKQPFSGQVNLGNITDSAPQISGLGGHDHESRQNSPAVNALGEKE